MNRAAQRFITSCAQAWPWLMILALSAFLVTQRGAFPEIIEYPTAWTLPIAEAVGFGMDIVVTHLRGVMRAVSSGLNVLFASVQALFVGAPWSVSVICLTLIAWQGGGWKLAISTALILLYILASGYWVPAMNTLSLVLVALPLSILIGFCVGYLAFRSRRASRIILPTLDLMQTIPAFAYLIPILLLFGFGPIVGLIASVIYAVPPMVRSTLLGFQQIPPAIVESARMSGCTRFQQFRWAEFPTALPQMLVGVNQTTMAALSMVIIAAIIGGFEDIGWEVLSAMRKAQFGHSLLSGAVIVVLAIMLDRMTASYAARQLPSASHVGLPFARLALTLIGATLLAFLAAKLIPSFERWPDAFVFSPAQAINDATNQFVLVYGGAMAAVKNAIQFFILLPVKLGFERAIVPFTWGFTFTPAMKFAYWAIIGLIGMLAFVQGMWKSGVAAFVLAGFLFFGATGLPWASVLLLCTLLGYQLGGPRLALLASGTLAFLLLTGLWEQSMISIYLSTVAVVVCILFGGLIGIWAASSDVFSGILRPINDTLQTLPQFVLLIPALMLFQVGDFTALLAVVAYAIVPMIRYTEHGLRSVPRTLIDAGKSCGLSAWQLFWQVRLPLALPQLLIGINQTILYVLGMLVIAAPVSYTHLTLPTTSRV